MKNSRFWDIVESVLIILCTILMIVYLIHNIIAFNIAKICYGVVCTVMMVALSYLIINRMVKK